MMSSCGKNGPVDFNFSVESFLKMEHVKVKTKQREAEK